MAFNVSMEIGSWWGLVNLSDVTLMIELIAAAATG
jgi:hypothetical protein